MGDDNILIINAKNPAHLFGVFVEFLCQGRIDRDDFEISEHGRLFIGKVAAGDMAAGRLHQLLTFAR